MKRPPGDTPILDAESIFLEVADLPVELRSLRLDELCRGNAEVRGRVEAWLRADSANADGLFAAPAHDVGDDEPPARVGRYQVVRTIGRGGMGVVYEAVQDQPRRKVALKLLRAGLASTRRRQRFEFEAELLGRLQHPCIAHVYEAGAAETVYASGTVQAAFIAMEFIDGQPLDAFVRGKDLTQRQRVALVAEIADAMDYAHRAGVIHRDLKPANILVTADGRSKILDFGIARALDSELHLTTLGTSAGAIGTLRYMSPEQASGRVDTIDRRSDIYSLGVILYELLCGRPPIELPDSSLIAALRQLESEEPRPIRRLNPTVPADLAIVVHKALQHDPEQRYESAADLAAELRRVLKSRPIQARPPSFWYAARMFARRRRTLVGSVATVLLILAVAGGLAIRDAAAQRRLRDDADVSSYRAAIKSAATALTQGDSGVAASALARAPAARRGWEWNYLDQRLDRPWFENRSIPDGLRVGFVPVEYSTDFSRAFVLRHDPAVNQLAVFELETHGWNMLRQLNFDGVPLATQFRILPDRECVAVLNLAEGVIRLAGLSDGTWLGEWQSIDCGPSPETRCAWALPDLDATVQLTRYMEPTVTPWALYFDSARARGQDIATTRRTSSEGRAAELYRPSDGSVSISSYETEVTAHRFDPSGQRLAIGTRGGELGVRTTADGAALSWSPVADHQAPLMHLTFSPDAALLATGSDSNIIHIRDTSSGTLVRPAIKTGEMVAKILFSPDGRDVFALGTDGMMHGWHVDRTQQAILGKHGRSVYPVVLSPDGQYLATGSWDGTVRVWNAATRSERFRISLPDDRGTTAAALALEFTPDGKTLIVAAGAHEWEGARLLAYNAGDGTLQGDLGPANGYIRMARDTAGGRVIVANTAGIWAVSQEPLAVVPLRTEPSGHACCAGSRGRESVICGAIASSAMLVMSPSMPERRLRCGDVGLSGAAIRPDGNVLAVGAVDGMLWIWNPQTGAPIAQRRVHDGPIFGLAFSPDGTRLATGGRDRSIAILDTTDYEQVLRLEGHEDYVYSLAWSLDGRTLYSGSGDGTVRIWAGAPDR